MSKVPIEKMNKKQAEKAYDDLMTKRDELLQDIFDIECDINFDIIPRLNELKGLKLDKKIGTELKKVIKKAKENESN